VPAAGPTIFVCEVKVGDKEFVLALKGLGDNEACLSAVRVRLAEICASILSAISSCDFVLGGIMDVLGTDPAQIKFKVCLPLEG
jgi:hypothetical protein